MAFVLVMPGERGDLPDVSSEKIKSRIAYSRKLDYTTSSRPVDGTVGQLKF